MLDLDMMELLSLALFWTTWPLEVLQQRIPLQPEDDFYHRLVKDIHKATDGALQQSTDGKTMYVNVSVMSSHCCLWAAQELVGVGGTLRVSSGMWTKDDRSDRTQSASKISF